MTNIPGTNYQVRGSEFIAPDGNTLTKDQFLEKVENKEISLTADSLRFLDSQFGPDSKLSLLRTTGMQVSAQELSTKLPPSSDRVMGDIFSLMEILAKVTQDLRKSVHEGKRTEFDAQMKQQESSADEALKAANIRMVAGIVSGVCSMTAGALSGAGGFIGGQETMQMTEGFGKLDEGIGKIGSAVLEQAAAGRDDASKRADINARKLDQMGQESRDLGDSLREMNSKVREVLRDIHNAESEAAKSVARM